MRLLFSIAASLFSFSASADVLLAIGAYQRLEKASSGYTYFLQNRIEYSAGYKWEQHAALLEYSWRKNESSSGSLEIHNKNQELMAWYRYELDFHRGEVAYYVLAGLGVSWNEISTYVGASSAEGSSDKSLVAGLGGAAFYHVNPHFAVGADIKILESDNNSSEPTFEVSMIKLLYSF